MAEEDHESGTQTIERSETDLKEPKLYKVILLNDDYTTMDFVVAVLEGIFGKTPAEATQIMLQVHHKGAGVCGMYPKQIAEAKIVLVEQKAQAEGHPLRCTMEEA